jgi:hypothetical protein
LLRVTGATLGNLGNHFKPDQARRQEHCTHRPDRVEYPAEKSLVQTINRSIIAAILAAACIHHPGILAGAEAAARQIPDADFKWIRWPLDSAPGQPVMLRVRFVAARGSCTTAPQNTSRNRHQSKGR